MAKDPAFLFYPGDWNLGTMHMTLLEKGCYMELLILQFAKGKFTEAQAKHMLNGSFDLAWANISEKFKTDGTFYWNERLRVEKEKRQKFTESRRSNGSIEKKEKKEGKHMLKHMEDKNENIDVLVLPKKNLGVVCYNVEEYILGNQTILEKICIATSRKSDEVKKELHLYHLWLAKKEMYPMGNGAAVAGIESWIHNSKTYKQKYGNTESVLANVEIKPNAHDLIKQRGY